VAAEQDRIGQITQDIGPTLPQKSKDRGFNSALRPLLANAVEKRSV
jgi:hypothetical protein